MSTEELRRRLERLNRESLASRRALGMRTDDREARPQPPNYMLDVLVPGEELFIGQHRCYGIRRRVVDAFQAPSVPGEALLRVFQNRGPFSRPVPHPQFDVFAAVPPEQILFMDIETCGFAGTPVFLIGVMAFHGVDLYVEQFLARDYNEEPAVLAGFADRLAQRPHLVSFNGKAFDWPFVSERCAAARVAIGLPATHCDLLHLARRRFKTTLPDCRLQTLERFVCRRRRVGDVPGSEIPSAYHRFVSDRDARTIRDIIHHNLLDLVTMADLLPVLVAGDVASA